MDQAPGNGAVSGAHSVWKGIMFWAAAVPCTQIFALEDLWSQLAKGGIWGASVCVQVLPRLSASQTCSWGMVCILTHCLGALQAGLCSCQDAR